MNKSLLYFLLSLLILTTLSGCETEHTRTLSQSEYISDGSENDSALIEPSGREDEEELSSLADAERSERSYQSGFSENGDSPQTNSELERHEIANPEYNLDLDIDSDSILERTIYDADTDTVQIFRNEEKINSISMNDVFETFDGISNIHRSCDYVLDASGKVYLHFYISSMIHGVNVYALTIQESYYDLKRNQWELVDRIEYSSLEDKQTGSTEQDHFYINGQPASSGDEIFNKYTSIANTYYEMPTK